MTHNLFTSQIESNAKVRLAKYDVQFIAPAMYDQTSRVICHGIKDNNPDAIVTAAFKMADCLPQSQDIVLVPAPSHKGYATNTLKLANLIAKISGAEVADILRGKERESNYSAKKAGHGLKPSDLGFYLNGTLPEGKLIVLCDNCCDTGVTAFAAANVLGSCVVLTYAMTGVLF